MEAKGVLLDTMKLSNGLTIHFYDQSRRIAGDRSQMQLRIEVPVGIEFRYFEVFPDSKQSYEDFTNQFGTEIRFQQVKTRNFIDLQDAPSVLEEMKREMLEANLAYLSKPNFPEKYVQMKYREWEKERAWKRNQ